MTELTIKQNKEKVGRLKPVFSVIIATRDRPDSLALAVESVLRNSGQDYELIVVDQSDNDATRLALAKFEHDPRLVYLHNDQPGVSRNRNLGISQAQGRLIAITDDDCAVAPDWLQRLEGYFGANPKLGVLFGRVSAADHDSTLGFIPEYKVREEALYRQPWEKLKIMGIGACMVFRKQTWEEIGGFDELLGPGGKLRAAEEGDFALRSLLKGWEIIITPRINVIHYGFRTWEEGLQLAQRNYFGIGAFLAKHLRLNPATALPLLAYEWAYMVYHQPLRNSLRRRRPAGLTPLVAFGQGFRAGMAAPLDPATGNFQAS